MAEQDEHQQHRGGFVELFGLEEECGANAEKIARSDAQTAILYPVWPFVVAAVRALRNGILNMAVLVWISLIFSIPIFIYSPMGMGVPAPTPPFGMDLKLF